MEDIKNIVKIGLGALGINKEGNFSAQDFKKAFDGEIASNFGCNTITDFMRIKYDVFDIMQEMADEYLPKRLNETLAKFCEIRQVPQGNKVEFKLKKGHNRGRSFVTIAAPSGEYETFRLDMETFQIPVKAYGAAALVDWERFLNGHESFVELMQIIAEGMEDRIYEQVQGLLQGAKANMPAANKKTYSAFNAAAMDSLLATVRAYGTPAIWCSQEFASTITNQVGFTSATPTISEQDLLDIRNQGYVGVYHGCPVIVMPQSFKDETNSEKIIDPKYAYVIPVGEEKIIKVVLEGSTQIQDFQNRDWSSEIQMYKKIGLAIVTDPNYWGIYENDSLS